MRVKFIVAEIFDFFLIIPIRNLLLRQVLDDLIFDDSLLNEYKFNIMVTAYCWGQLKNLHYYNNKIIFTYRSKTYYIGDFSQ